MRPLQEIHIPLHLFDPKKSISFQISKNAQIFEALFSANFAETHLYSAGISQNIQKMLQNSTENLKKTAKKM